MAFSKAQTSVSSLMSAGGEDHSEGSAARATTRAVVGGADEPGRAASARERMMRSASLDRVLRMSATVEALERNLGAALWRIDMLEAQAIPVVICATSGGDKVPQVADPKTAESQIHCAFHLRKDMLVVWDRLASLERSAGNHGGEGVWEMKRRVNCLEERVSASEITANSFEERFIHGAVPERFSQLEREICLFSDMLLRHTAGEDELEHMTMTELLAWETRLDAQIEKLIALPSPVAQNASLEARMVVMQRELAELGARVSSVASSLVRTGSGCVDLARVATAAASMGTPAPEYVDVSRLADVEYEASKNCQELLDMEKRFTRQMAGYVSELNKEFSLKLAGAVSKTLVETCSDPGRIGKLEDQVGVQEHQAAKVRTDVAWMDRRIEGIWVVLDQLRKGVVAVAAPGVVSPSVRVASPLGLESLADAAIQGLGLEAGSRVFLQGFLKMVATRKVVLADVAKLRKTSEEVATHAALWKRFQKLGLWDRFTGAHVHPLKPVKIVRPTTKVDSYAAQMAAAGREFERCHPTLFQGPEGRVLAELLKFQHKALRDQQLEERRKDKGFVVGVAKVVPVPKAPKLPVFFPKPGKALKPAKPGKRSSVSLHEA